MHHVRTLVLAAMLAILASPAIAQSQRGYPRLMQGPMLGVVTTTTANIWIRGSGAYPYAIEYSTNPDFSDSRITEPVDATKDNDYTHVFTIERLRPSTRYYYRAHADGAVAKYMESRVPAWFETPAEGLQPVRIALGSCARVQSSLNQPIWTVVHQIEPDIFIWLGDNIYGDALDPDILAEEYRRQRDLLTLQPVLRSVQHLSIWDDHDFGLNNHDRSNPIKQDALRVFKQYWPNPSFGTDSTPGVFFKHSIPGVDMFFLDARYHRDPNEQPDSPEKTMLGKAQYDWLIEGLSSSDATFKLIISGSGFNKAKGPTGDSWSAFIHERDRLFNEIAERGINGVVLVSGDTHAGELNAIESPHPAGYTLYELVSSPLAQAPTARRQPLSEGERRVRPYYNRAANAGVIDIDPTQADPVLRFNLVNMFGEFTWETFEVRASELVVRSRP